MRFLSAFARLNSGKIGLLSGAIKWLLIILITIMTLSSCLSKTSFAQTIPQSTNPVQEKMSTGLEPGIPLTARNWTQVVMINVMSAMSCQLAGMDPSSPNGRCLGTDPVTGKIGYVKSGGGVPTALVGMIAQLYTPPVQFSDYTNYLAQNFGIAKPSYAQGVGFNQLLPIIDMWRTMRDIVYLLFVVVMLIVGVAIMLRLKIDPRTVMTVQNQIPKLIIGLVLITFSYAIAGLMVDFMWVSTYGVANIIAPGNRLSEMIAKPAPGFVGAYLPGGLSGVALPASDNMKDMIVSVFSSLTAPVAGTQPGPDQSGQAQPKDGCSFWIFCGVTNLIGDSTKFVVNTIGDLISMAGGFFGNVIGGIVGGVVNWIIQSLVFLILMFMIIFSLFKLWVQLLKAFIFVLIDVIFAPFWILGGLIPGASGSVGFSAWLKDLAGNLAAFPAVVALFSIAKAIMSSYPTTSANAFIPPLVGNLSESGGLASMIALGIILTSPTVVEAVKKAFKAPGFGGIGMPGLGVGMAAAGAVGGAVWSRMYYRDPRTGETHGAAVNAGRNFTHAVTHSTKIATAKRAVTVPVNKVVQSNPVTRGAATAVNVVVHNPVTQTVGKVITSTGNAFRDPNRPKPSGGSGSGGSSTP